MNKMNNKFRISLYFLVPLIVLAVSIFIWADMELKSVLGSSTKEIQINDLVKEHQGIIIQNTNVLSEDCSYFKENLDVVIQNGLIEKIELDTKLESNYLKIDGSDKYLIPGLIDSHVHLKESKNDLYLYLVNGITYVREMSGRPIVIDWKNTKAVTPKIFVASPLISSEKGIKGLFFSWSRKTINYTTEEEAEEKIQELSQQGYDALKIYSFTNSEMAKASMNMAKKFNLKVVGHIPNENLGHFFETNQKEVAHIEELVKKSIHDFDNRTSDLSQNYYEYLEAYSDSIAKLLKEKDIFITSTQALTESFVSQRFALDSALKNVKLEYVNPKILEGTPLHRLGWLPDENIYEYQGSKSTEDIESSRKTWTEYVQASRTITKALIRNNVDIMAGTDANTPIMVPGFSLHDELKCLNQMGMKNSEVLYSATVQPSEWMGSKTGIIKEGYQADLVLLSSNPLKDITNTKKIEYVFLKDYFIDNNQIKRILAEIKQMNDKHRSSNIETYLD